MVRVENSHVLLIATASNLLVMASNLKDEGKMDRVRLRVTRILRHCRLFAVHTT